MSHQCRRNFWDRREFLFTSGGGISGLALAYLLGQDDLLAASAAARRVRGCRHGRESVCAEASAPQAARHRRHLAVHGRRLEPDGHVRSEARADEIRGRADRRQGPRRRHRAAGLPRAADAEPVLVQEVRAERHRGVGDLPAPQPACRRDRVPALGLWPFERSRPGHLRDADRPDQPRVPERGLVGHLRPGIGGVEPAGIRGDDRRARRPARRAQRLERGLHAGGVPGHAVPIDGRSDRRSQAARRA